jgi:hypothetical protein
MAAQLIAGTLAPQLDAALPAAPGDWLPTAGVLRDVYFDSGEGPRAARNWAFTARVSELELSRGADQAKLSQLAADLRFDAREFAMRFDAAQPASLRAPQTTEARPLSLAGQVALLRNTTPAWRFTGFTASSGTAKLTASGDWNRTHRVPHRSSSWSRTWTGPVAGRLVARGRRSPAARGAGRIGQGRLIDASFELLPDDDGAVNWSRSTARCNSRNCR